MISVAGLRRLHDELHIWTKAPSMLTGRKWGKAWPVELLAVISDRCNPLARSHLPVSMRSINKRSTTGPVSAAV